MTETKPSYNLKSSPFTGLFQKHPWLLPVFAMLYRQMGILREFYEINIKPHAKKQ